MRPFSRLAAILASTFSALPPALAQNAPETVENRFPRYNGSIGTWFEHDHWETDSGTNYDKTYFYGRLFTLNVEATERLSFSAAINFGQVSDFGYAKDDVFTGHDVRLSTLRADYTVNDDWQIAAGKFGTTPQSIFTEIPRLGVDLTRQLDFGWVDFVTAKIYTADITPLSASFFGQRPQTRRDHGGLTNSDTPSFGVGFGGAVPFDEAPAIDWGLDLDYLQGGDFTTTDSMQASLSLSQTFAPEDGNGPVHSWLASTTYTDGLYGIDDYDQFSLIGRYKLIAPVAENIDLQLILTAYCNWGDDSDAIDPSIEFGPVFHLGPNTKLDVRVRAFGYHDLNELSPADNIDDANVFGIGIILEHKFGGMFR